MGITPRRPRCCSRHPLVLRHQRPLLLRLVLLVRRPRSLGPDVFVHPIRPHLHPLPTSTTTSLARPAILVHILQRSADAQEEQHQLLLREAGVVDQVGVDHVLQVAAAVVGQQDVDGLGLLAAAALGRDGVVDAVDDARAVREELVRLHLLHGLRDRLGPERAPDLLEREELRRRRVLHEVDVREATLPVGGKRRSEQNRTEQTEQNKGRGCGEDVAGSVWSAYLAQQAQDLQAAIVDFERWRARKAIETAPEGGNEVKQDLSHGGRCHSEHVLKILIRDDYAFDR